VVVTGSPGERSIAGAVARAAGLPPEAVLAGRTGLGELAALVADARLVVAGDTGIGHLATAYDTPSVLLFGPVSPALWGPPPDRPGHEALWVGPRPPGDGTQVHPALTELDVPTVLAAVDRVDRAWAGRLGPASPLVPARRGRADLAATTGPAVPGGVGATASRFGHPLATRR
jgi:ADP-heptose:LPS heptosyltransferase